MNFKWIATPVPGQCNQEWVWDTKETTNATVLKHGNQEVCFHPSYSSGTAAVRGNVPCVAGHDYYWEIEMISPLYGTDVMVGVGTPKADLKKYQFQFGSLLGSDDESWGYSYNGILYHNGQLRQYGSGFGQGNIIGIHLDMWQGTLTFYIDRNPLGVAFTSLRTHTLYPMVCSTAARSAMRIVCAYSNVSSLQLLCLKSLGSKFELARNVKSIPGLRSYAEKAFWHFFPAMCNLSKVSKRQCSKRSCGSRDKNWPDLQSLCVICQHRDRPKDEPSVIEGNSSKRMCLMCNIIF